MGQLSSDDGGEAWKRAHMDKVRKALASLAYPSANSKPGDAAPACSKLSINYNMEFPWERTSFFLEFTNGTRLSGLLKDLTVEVK